MHDGPGIVVLADPRYPGGTTRAICAEARALRNAGASAGFCPILGPELRRAARLHPDIAPFVEDGTLRLVDLRERQRVRLLVVHHPALFRHPPPQPLGLVPDRIVLVLHHPPLDGLGRPDYDLAGIVANLAESFGQDVTFGPVGPAVRAQLHRLGVAESEVLPEDWTNLIDFTDWPRRSARPDGPDLVLGRHSRPFPAKFPDSLAEALLAYPETPGVQVRMLGAPEDLATRYGRIPVNWSLLPFDAEPVRDFLRSLHYFVYLHGSSWVEAFGYGILEAIATGVPVVLPPSFRESFGRSALYAEPERMQNLIAEMEEGGLAYEAHIEEARRAAEERFSIDLFPSRLDRVAPGWDASAAHVPARPLQPLRTVMVTSNGVGLGHLTRLMAIARNLPDRSETAFFTLSQSFRLAAEAGYLTQFVPFHKWTGAPVEAWNLALSEELGDFLDLVRPDLVVFDGNMPYEGLMGALDQRRQICRAWVRRAMWRAELPAANRRAGDFDLVIEPGELSGRLDIVGLKARASAVVVPPIIGTRPADRLPRDLARAELGLPGEGVVLGLMLGTATNFDFGAIRRAILDHLRIRPEVQVIEIGPEDGRPAEDGANRHRAVLYPAARHSAAFDVMVTSAGYNSFHEAMLHGVPTVFVPNEAAEMDLQILRARHARSMGRGELLRASDAISVRSVLDRMLDPEERAGMRERLRRIRVGDGAAEAAGLLSQLGRMLRLRQPL